MEENASGCNAVLILSISSEDEREFPEAVALIQSIASSLGPNGESPEVLAELQKVEEEYREINGILTEKLIFLCAVKEVLREEQLNGYQRLPQDVVEKIMDSIVLAEMNQKYKENVNNILGVSSDVNKPVDLTESQKSILMKAVEEKILQLDGPTDGKERYDEAENNLIRTQLLIQAKIREEENQEIKLEESMKELVALKKDRMEIHKLNVQIKKLQLEIEMYKKNIAHSRVAKELFGEEEIEAIKKLESDTSKKLKKAAEENEQLREHLKLYTLLPKEEFDPIVKEYREVSKQVENAQWSIKKLEEGGD